MKKDIITNPKLNNEDLVFIELLKRLFNGETLFWEELDREVLQLYGMRNGTLPLFCDNVVVRGKEPITSIVKPAEKASVGFQILLKAAGNVLEALEAEGIEAVLLKGASVASYYPVPQYRVSSDVDILVIDADKYSRAVEIVGGLGYGLLSEKIHPHHDTFKNEMGVVLELHKEPARPFGKKCIDPALGKIFHNPSCIEKRDILGVLLNTLTPGAEAEYLIIHMLEHYMGAGFGINMLCDWYWFLKENKGKDIWDGACAFYKDSKISGFFDAVTALTVKYLGLERECVPCDIRAYDEDFLEAFMKEIMDAGRHGGSVNSVVNPSGGMLGELARQTGLSFPGAYKIHVIRPFLMAFVGIRFMINNKKVRNTKTMDVIRNSGARRTLFAKMEVFI